MCGIAGIIAKLDAETSATTVKDMLSAIEHRGPDSSGFWSRDNFAFGMQRLSIIDIKGGDQPIWSDDGVGIVFNGEIYNFKSLKAGLKEQGYLFKTNSDTEVILHLYRNMGIAAVSLLEGMFAICIYDTNENSVYLVRDRLGVKPLYYYSGGGELLFASEIKSLLKGLRSLPNVNNQAVWDMLTLRYVPSPNTIWENIYKLEPGKYLKFNFNDGCFEIHKYWDLQIKSSKKLKNKDYNKEFEELFLSAVNKRLLSADVPVGVLLSGGLDSSCVAVAAKELGYENLHTFSIGFKDNKDCNELEYARTVADYIKSNHHELIIDKEEFLSFLDDFVWYSDEPLADLASIPLFYVSKLASQHVKVVLSGEGADEVLLGYDFDKLGKKFKILKAFSLLPKRLLNIMPFASCKNLAVGGYDKFLHNNLIHITNIFSEQEKEKLCKFEANEKTDIHLQNIYSLSTSKKLLDKVQQGYCNSWLVEDLLMKADKMSMATSLELRVPFLDHKLVEWAATLPMQYKIGSFTKGFTTKKILRDFARTRLPKRIIDRPKQGFPVPAYKWLKEDLSGFVERNLYSSNMQKLFNMDVIKPILQEAYNGCNKSAHKIWNLIIYSKWMEQWQN